jgi:hypothetical protein
MKKIILSALGLAMFATPLAAGNPHSSGYAQHELHRYGIERPAPFSRTQQLTSRFSPTPAGSQSFGLVSGTNPSGAHYARPGLDGPHFGIGMPVSTPPQGWALNR